jgi:hypothetical protein
MILEQPEIIVESGPVADITIRLRAEESDLETRSNKVMFFLEAVEDDKLQVIKEARFLGPG